jgi:hypothetical protein
MNAGDTVFVLMSAMVYAPSRIVLSFAKTISENQTTQFSVFSIL